MPELPHPAGGTELRAPIAAFLASARRRLLIVAWLRGTTAGAACAAATALLARLAGWPAPALTIAPLALGGFSVVLVALPAWRSWTTSRVARIIEARAPQLENLLVTAEEIVAKRRAVHPLITAEILRQSGDRLSRLRLSSLVPLQASWLVAALVCAGSLLTWWRVPSSGNPLGISIPSGTSTRHLSAMASYTVRVEPPTYTGYPVRSLENPTEVRVLEGSRVRIDAVRSAGVELLDEGGRPTPLSVGDRQSTEFVAEHTRFLLLRPTAASGAPVRLVSLIVDADRRPVVRIAAPGRDLAFLTSVGRVPLQVQAEDDVALATLEVRYTHVAGSGEAFTFKEGVLPLNLARPQRARWEGKGELSLAALNLEEGDTVVYRAIARDHKPGGDPAVSESFVIEIGRLGAAASGGFALPEDKDRQAISQQMVIVKTERLQATRGKLAREAFAEQSRMLAVEQRMVRAEFVFMTGGEVEDEIAEAEHSHDLAEGRFENEEQVALLTAIREMSRAEAALNDADTSRALAFERAALAALQRAFDRRRYFLRTSPERARIDPTRRLSGERAAARPWSREPSEPRAPGELGALRSVLDALASSRQNTPGTLTELAARLGALAPEDPAWQTVVRALADADRASPDWHAAKESAVRSAMELVSARARRLLAVSARGDVPNEPLAGRYADERVRPGLKPRPFVRPSPPDRPSGAEGRGFGLGQTS